ncbi:MAG TPA: hypothetical protein GXZ82_14460 [Firmicutes bacterium]|jgi:uroporphyrinogen decarboxylase|nr:hypothetical protein [Bacillota bacterium]
MSELTTHERMSRIFAHKEADRAPISDVPWRTTLQRWHREGMPKEVSWVDFFGVDNIVGIGVDGSPRYPVQVLEQNDEYTIKTTAWGATLKEWVHTGGVPEFLDFTIVDRVTWEEAKARMTPSPDRVNWQKLQVNYPEWRKQGAWIRAGLWFGFDVTHSWVVGTERVLFALMDDPEWLMDIWNHQLDVQLALYDQVWEAGYHFDEITWPDDMGYKGTQFFSVQMYRDLLQPVHKRAVDWAHAHGVKVRLHSCGDVRPFVPEFIKIGIDCLNPIEVKAGMDPLQLKEQYGAQLAFHGGLNAVLYDDMDAMIGEMEKVIPKMIVNGGYIIGTDHSIPDSVGIEQFRRFVAKAKELGKY